MLDRYLRIAMLGGCLLSCSGNSTGPNAHGIADVAMIPDTLTISAGDSATVQAQAVNAAGAPVPGVSLFWSTSDSTIATVDQRGMVRAVSLGAVNIDASAAGVSPKHPARVVVVAQPAASIVIAPKSVSMALGGAFQFTDTTKDAAGHALTGRVVSWASSDTTVAPVDQAGFVLAKRLGSVTITVSSGSVSATATVTVSRVPVARIVIVPTNPTVIVGQETQFSATPQDSAGNILNGIAITWSSSNPTTATIDQTGTASGKKAGAVTITASSGSISVSTSLTVQSASANAVTLSPQLSSLTVGQTLTMTASVTDANGSPVPNATVTFSSGSPNVATVTSTGALTATVTAVGSGQAQITGTSGGRTGTATVNVAPVPVGSVTINPPSATIAQGGTVQLAATVKDTAGHVLTGRTITWTSLNQGVAAVSSTGLVAGVSTGEAVISASTGGQSGLATITVKQGSIASVVLTPNAFTVSVHGTQQVTAQALDGSGHPVSGVAFTWTTKSSGSIASVNASGTVSGVAVGNDSVFASAAGKTGGAAVTVAPAGVNTVIVTPDTATITNSNNSSVQLTATLLDAQGDTLVGPSITWSSDNPDVAVVSATGLVMANDGGSHGTATIRATSQGKQGTATVKVLDGGGGN